MQLQENKKHFNRHFKAVHANHKTVFNNTTQYHMSIETPGGKERLQQQETM